MKHPTSHFRLPASVLLVIAAVLFLAPAALAGECDETWKGSCASASVCGQFSETKQIRYTEECTANGQVCCAPRPGTETARPAETPLAAPATGATESTKGKTIVAYGLINPLGSRSIHGIAAAIIKYASGVAGTLMLVFIIWGGVQYMGASDPKAVSDARQRILWAILGMGVIFLSYVMIDAIMGISSLPPGA